MRDRLSHLLLAPALLGAAFLVVPEHAVAQDCVGCRRWSEDETYWTCKPVDGMGHQACTLTQGGKQCNTSSNPEGGGPDCGLVIALDGRGLGSVSDQGVRDAAAGADGRGQASSLSGQREAGMPSVVTRHACTGAIIDRTYEPSRVGKLRSGLRHVSI